MGGVNFKDMALKRVENPQRELHFKKLVEMMVESDLNDIKSNFPLIFSNKSD